MMKKLISFRHAAELCDFKDTRPIKHLVQSGQLRARKIGNRNFIVASSLDEFCGENAE